MATRTRIKLPPLTPGAVCHYCKTAPGVGWDHVIPQAILGTNDPSNLVPSCERCNNEKKDMWPDCKCEFCRSAVEAYLAHPGYLDYAIETQERRRRIFKGRSYSYLVLSLERMYAEKRALTSTTTTSKVETS